MELVVISPLVSSQKIAPYNQLKPGKVGRIKGLRETGLTYRQIKDHVGRPISTISSVLTK